LPSEVAKPRLAYRGDLIGHGLVLPAAESHVGLARIKLLYV
jgi:hypothetical protein